MFAMLKTFYAGNKLIVWGLAAGAVLGLLVVLFFVIREGGKDAIRAEDAKAVAADQAAAAKANEKAAAERRADDAALAAQHEENTDAINSAADGRPSDASRALNCKRLRRAGYDLKKLPEPARSDCAAEAARHP